MANIIQAFPKGNGGGHTILDTDGTAVGQEKKLQFTGLDVSDDSTNEKTEVKAVGLNTDSLNDIIQSASVQGNVVAGNGLVYSTTEQIVGRWVDGKPLYQKTWILKPPTVIKTSQVIGQISSDLLASIQIKDMQTVFNGWPSGHVVYNMDRSYVGQESPIWIRTNGEIAAQVPTELQTDQRNEIYMTLKYIKTTD